MILFAPEITPRLQYITGFIGHEIWGQVFQLTMVTDTFRDFDGPKINYSKQRITADEFFLRPHPLLTEKTIRAQSIECFTIKNYKAFFKTEGDFPFDIFSACFYLLSRYEEYLPHRKDMYGRYAHENSVAFKEEFLHLPLVNNWVEDFRENIQVKFPHFPFLHTTFRFLPTYDIDEAFSYKHKDWWRTTGAVGKAILKKQFTRIRERRKVLRGQLNDPYDSYIWMDQLHEKYQLKPRYFFLVPEQVGKYDRNILPKEKALQELIRQHAEKYDIGVHPSWQSGDDPSLIKKEIATVAGITGKTITASRQHFIRFTLPQTFRYLLQAGVKEDFSMGYGGINGFRASVASPFYWYDLDKEEGTDLLLYPFCFMEANSFFEQKVSPGKALEEMRRYYTAVRSVKGTFISIWHNTFLGTDRLYAGWREVYEEFIREIS